MSMPASPPGVLWGHLAASQHAKDSPPLLPPCSGAEPRPRGAACRRAVPTTRRDPCAQDGASLASPASLLPRNSPGFLSHRLLFWAAAWSGGASGGLRPTHPFFMDIASSRGWGGVRPSRLLPGQGSCFVVLPRACLAPRCPPLDERFAIEPAPTSVVPDPCITGTQQTLAKRARTNGAVNGNGSLAQSGLRTLSSPLGRGPRDPQ